MNERDISQTQTETIKKSPFDAVEIQHFSADDRVQKVYLPGEGVGIVTGVGELTADDGTKVLVGEVSYIKDDKVRTARGPMDRILAIDAERRAEQERQAPLASKMGETALEAVAEPHSVSDPEQYPEDWAVPRSEILALIANEQEKAQPLITGIPEHLRPDGYIPSKEDSDDSRRVPVAMPPNPHGALGFPNREDYLKSLGQKPDSHN